MGTVLIYRIIAVQSVITEICYSINKINGYYVYRILCLKASLHVAFNHKNCILSYWHFYKHEVIPRGNCMPFNGIVSMGCSK